MQGKGRIVGLALFLGISIIGRFSLAPGYLLRCAHIQFIQPLRHLKGRRVVKAHWFKLRASRFPKRCRVRVVKCMMSYDRLFTHFQSTTQKGNNVGIWCLSVHRYFQNNAMMMNDDEMICLHCRSLRFIGERLLGDKSPR